MVRFVRVALLLPVVLLAAGQARPADEKVSSFPYFPTAVGTTWYYHVGENQYAVKVTKHEEFGGRMCARLEMVARQGKEAKTVSYEHIAVTQKGVVRVGFEGKKLEPPVPFLRLPTKDTSSWKVESKLGGQVFRGEFKVGEERNVKVPAGTFSTIVVTGKKLNVNGVDMDVTYYFAEKVGMVKQVIEMAGQKIVIELDRFEPAKKKKKAE